jgi:four helix bundle protein
MSVESYKDLVVWKKSMDLVIEIYALTKKLPKNETYGLMSQMQRAATSIPSNIAEGGKRGHLPEYIQFLLVAYGSGAELETQLEICKRLSFLNNSDYNKVDPLLEEVMKMLNVLISKLSTKRNVLKPTTHNLKPKHD